MIIALLFGHYIIVLEKTAFKFKFDRVFPFISSTNIYTLRLNEPLGHFTHHRTPPLTSETGFIVNDKLETYLQCNTDQVFASTI